MVRWTGALRAIGLVSGGLLLGAAVGGDRLNQPVQVTPAQWPPIGPPGPDTPRHDVLGWMGEQPPVSEGPADCGHGGAPTWWLGVGGVGGLRTWRCSYVVGTRPDGVRWTREKVHSQVHT